MSRAALLLVVAACVDRPRGTLAGLTPGRDSADSAFALAKPAVPAAMGRSIHLLSSIRVAAGRGWISLQRDPSDSAGVAQIRSHMRRIAAAFARGDYALPGWSTRRPWNGGEGCPPSDQLLRRPCRAARSYGEDLDPFSLAAIHQFPFSAGSPRDQQRSRTLSSSMLLQSVAAFSTETWRRFAGS